MRCLKSFLCLMIFQATGSLGAMIAEQTTQRRIVELRNEVESLILSIDWTNRRKGILQSGSSSGPIATGDRSVVSIGYRNAQTLLAVIEAVVLNESDHIFFALRESLAAAFKFSRIKNSILAWQQETGDSNPFLLLKLDFVAQKLQERMAEMVTKKLA